MGQPSTRDTVNARVGDANVWIDYGRPAKRGRVIWGNVGPVRYRVALWRERGRADQDRQDARHRRYDGPCRILQRVATPERRASYLILNTATKQWGTNYDASKDLVRILVRKHVGPPAGEERFRVLVQSGKLLMLWDEGGYEVDLRAK